MLYLHAGFHKTGTTSIQATLFANREKIRGHGVNYFGYAPNHSAPLLAAFSTRPSVPVEQLRQRLAHADVGQTAIEVKKNLDDFLADPSGPTKIISAEALSAFTAPELACFKSHIDKFGLETRVVFYVRNYFDYLRSRLQENVRWGASLPNMKKMISNGGTVIQGFSPSITLFAQVFGADNIKVRLFHKDCFEGGDLVRDFCAAIGHEDIFGIMEQKRLNESMSETNTCLMSDYNELFPMMVDGAYNAQRAHKAIGYFSKDDGPKFRLADEDVLDAFARQSERDLETLAPFLDDKTKELIMQRTPEAGPPTDGASSNATYDLAVRRLGETLVNLEDTEAVLDVVLNLLKDKGQTSAKTRAKFQTNLPKLRSDVLCRQLARALLVSGRIRLSELAAKRALEINDADERNVKICVEVARALAKQAKRRA